MQAAVFNAQAGDPDRPGDTSFRVNSHDGQLFISEFAIFHGKDDPSKLYGKYGMGAWGYTRTFENQVTGDPAPSYGAYFLGEQSVNQLITLFLKYGVASGETNQIGSTFSAGLVTTGLIPGRTKDRFGFGISKVNASGQYSEAQTAAGVTSLAAETAYELTYRLELYQGISIVPDFQWVGDPGLDPALDDAFVGTMRLEVNF